MATTFIEPAEATAFLERMLDDGGMKDLEAEVREQMLADLRSRLQNALFATVVMKLPEAELPAFNALIERNAPSTQLQEFIRERISNLDDVIAQAMLEFRKQYVKV